MIIRLLSIVTCLLLTTLHSFGQYGNVEGNIRTPNGKPANHVKVTIKGSAKETVTDQQGNVVPDAAQLISFSVEGKGTLAGVDNGYQANIASFKAPQIKAFKGKCMVIIRSGEEPGYIYIKAKAQDLGETVFRLSSR